MEFLKNRRIKKLSKEIIRHARYARNMREDIAEPQTLGKLNSAEADLRSAMEDKDIGRMESSIRQMDHAICHVWPRPSFPVIREYTEILVVAFAVAMTFRAYFLQPFKIPTGSMQPTLKGIHSMPFDEPRSRDRFPLNLANWLWSGEWYKSVTAKSSGEVIKLTNAQNPNGVYDVYVVSGSRHLLPRDATPRVAEGDFVKKGDVIWSGVETSGDHVFVDKMSWNFRKPRRSEVMVFETTGIAHSQLPQNKHYIKRMVGMPGDELGLIRPFVYTNGVAIDDDSMIGRIGSQEADYDGYFVVVHPNVPREYQPKESSWSLGEDEYFAMGDNSGSSFDSRYWGPVPEANLVGPAAFVYWPFSRRGKIAR